LLHVYCPTVPYPFTGDEQSSFYCLVRYIAPFEALQHQVTRGWVDQTFNPTSQPELFAGKNRTLAAHVKALHLRCKSLA